MSIVFNKNANTFHLQTKDCSYIIGVFENKYLLSLYYGKKVNDVIDPTRMMVVRELGFAPSPADCFYKRSISLDTLPQEFPSFGYGDYRSPAIQVKQENGSRLTDFIYDSFDFVEKEKIEGMPSINPDDDCDTLKIVLVDKVAKLKANLYYNVYASRNVITRHVVLENLGNKSVEIKKIMSMSFDLRDSSYTMLDLHGTHCMERQIEKVNLHHGATKVESRRGSSSHQMNPFFALLKGNVDEYQGECYGFNLVYSGNFEGLVEIDQRETTRVQMGINSFDFSWKLNPNEKFYTPEVVMVYSSSGLNAMSQEFHRLYNDCLLKKHYFHPIVCNNWEATYFNFNDEKLDALIDSCKGLGIETFVLDDGWFGRRVDGDESGLGDWTVNTNKLKKGLKGVYEACKRNGLNFGLWFEPEMIQKDSKLYEDHPDWVIKVGDRDSIYSRCQWVLDLSKDEVCNYIIDSISKIVDTSNISYIKWDFNRNITETYNEELNHRYVLGYYKVLETLTTKYPNLMIEGCSGGGGRFDPAALYYTPQIWTSDDSDAIQRLFIQYGTSICYPPTAMVGHVSICPNHQTGRITPFNTRGVVAMSANFGYELNPQVLNEEERKQVKEQTATYARIRKLLYNSDFYRLRSPFEGKDSAWSFVSYDKKDVAVMYTRILNGATNEFDWLTLKGLDKEKVYKDINTNKLYTGEELETIGILLPRWPRDFESILIELKEVED